MEKTDFLWKVIQRYDTYIGSTNAKAAFLIAWNTFLFGTTLLKSPDLSVALNNPNKAWLVAAFWALAISVIISALASLWFTFRVVNPYLKSPSKPMEYHSLIFFGAVAKFSPEKYHEEIKGLDEEKAVRDLSFQAHAVAVGTAAKFAALKIAIGIVLVQIPLLLAIVGLFIFNHFSP